MAHPDDGLCERRHGHPDPLVHAPTATDQLHEPQPDVQRVLLRQRGRRQRRLRPRGREPGRQDRHRCVGRPRGWRLPADPVDRRERPHRPARRPVGRPLRQAHLACPRRQPVQALRHVAGAGDRPLRHAVQQPAGRWRRRGQSREVHRRQPPAVGRGRLRAARGGRHRRGHLRRAGSRPRAGVQPPGHQLHPRRAAARHRARDGRLPVHRRGPAPVHGAGQPDRRRRRPEPVLRRHPEVRRRAVHRGRYGRSRGHARGVHPQRLRGRRREAGRRPRH